MALQAGQLDHAQEHLLINIGDFTTDATDYLIGDMAEHNSSGRTTWVPGNGTRPNLKLEGLTWDELLVFCVAYDSEHNIGAHRWPGPVTSLEDWPEGRDVAQAAAIPTAVLAATVHTPASSLRHKGGGSHAIAITLAGVMACQHMEAGNHGQCDLACPRGAMGNRLIKRWRHFGDYVSRMRRTGGGTHPQGKTDVGKAAATAAPLPPQAAADGVPAVPTPTQTPCPPSAVADAASPAPSGASSSMPLAMATAPIGPPAVAAAAMLTPLPFDQGGYFLPPDDMAQFHAISDGHHAAAPCSDEDSSMAGAAGGALGAAGAGSGMTAAASMTLGMAGYASADSPSADTAATSEVDTSLAGTPFGPQELDAFPGESHDAMEFDFVTMLADPNTEDMDCSADGFQ